MAACRRRPRSLLPDTHVSRTRGYYGWTCAMSAVLGGDMSPQGSEGRFDALLVNFETWEKTSL